VLVALRFGSNPVLCVFFSAKPWIDRATDLFLGALSLRLLTRASDIA
jgi:hypothetical protein